MAGTVTLPPDGGVRPDGLRPGGWWHSRADGRIVCDLCPRGCALKDGDRGFCFVRQNRGGEMWLTTYGRSTGFCIDPVEKKPLNHFYPGTAILSFGTAGCCLACKFCQNWSMSRSREIASLSELASPAEIAEAAELLGCRGVAFTYNDPVIWAEYALDTARACHERGIKTIAKTSGYITSAARQSFFAAMDAANVDLKAFNEEFYQHLTLSHLAPVLETLHWLKHESVTWFEITNLLIPQANDAPADIQWMCDWLLDNVGDEVPVHFTAFYPTFRLSDRPPTPAATLTLACAIARKAGLKYVYTGNVYDPLGQSTCCPNCGTVVIGRSGYTITAYRLVEGCCAVCGQPIAGRFDAAAGNWGARCVPVPVRALLSRKRRAGL